MKEMGVPGMAVTVVRGDEVIYTATFGERDPVKHLPVTPDTVFYIASCTKSFMAMAVMSLVEEGKVDLDASVKKYLPRFVLSDSSLTETLSVRDLLSHAKGINSQPIVFLDAFTGEITEDRFYHWLKTAEIRRKFAYSNLHYTLAGRVAEAVTGKPWKDVLEDRIFGPAEMTRSTAYAAKMYGDADAGIPCEVREGKIVPTEVRKTDQTMHAAGGLGASITDLGKWLEINLNGGVVNGKRIVSESTIAEMQKTQARGEENEFLPNVVRTGYGLGWMIGTYCGVPRLEHGGGYTGTSAHVSFMPQHKLGVAAIANAGGALPHVVAMDVYDRILKLEGADVLPELQTRAQKGNRREEKRVATIRKNPLTAQSLSRPIEEYVGTYVHPDWGTVVIERQEDHLKGHVGGLPLALSAVGTDRFNALVGGDQEEEGRFETSDAVKAIVIALAAGDTDVRFERAK